MTYDEETHNSYQVKKLISLVQNCRKEKGFKAWDVRVRICLNILILYAKIVNRS